MRKYHISIRERNIVAEAQAAGSSATTRKGAIRYLVAAERKRTRTPLRGMAKLSARMEERAAGRLPEAIDRPWYWETDSTLAAWQSAQAERTAHPEAKRARADAAYRKTYLARIRREERRLVESAPADPDAAYARLDAISIERAIATGKRRQPVPDRAWMTGAEARETVAEIAHEAGLSDDWDGHSWCDDRGDHHSLEVLDWRSDPAYMIAAGRLIGLVEQLRRRVYAKRSQFRKSDRADRFLVGRNENGRAFLHQVPATVGSVAEAWSWIWGGAEITARQGDIGLAPSHLKHVEGEESDWPVAGGHSRHRFIGEVYRNGSLHVRGGFLYHEGNQHPTIYVGAEWMRVVEARRSERRMSTSD